MEIVSESFIEHQLGNMYDLITLRIAKDKTFARFKSKEAIISKMHSLKDDINELVEKFPSHQIKCSLLFNFSALSSALAAGSFGISLLVTGLGSGDWGLFKSYMISSMRDILNKDRDMFTPGYEAEMRLMEKLGKNFNSLASSFVNEFLPTTDDIKVIYNRLVNNAEEMLKFGGINNKLVMLTIYCYVTLVEDLLRFNVL